jgi:hypothetical protein
VQVRDLDRQLGLFDLVASHDVAELGQSLVGGVAGLTHLFEPLGAGARRLELLAVRRVERLLGDADLLRGPRHQLFQAPEDLEVELEGLATPGRLGPLAGAALQALLDLRLTLLDEPSSLTELRLASRQRRRAFADASAVALDEGLRLLDQVLTLAGFVHDALERRNLRHENRQLLLDARRLHAQRAHVAPERLARGLEFVDRLVQPLDLTVAPFQFGLRLGGAGRRLVEGRSRTHRVLVGQAVTIANRRHGVVGLVGRHPRLFDRRARDDGATGRHPPS